MEEKPGFLERFRKAWDNLYAEEPPKVTATALESPPPPPTQEPTPAAVEPTPTPPAADVKEELKQEQKSMSGNPLDYLPPTARRRYDNLTQTVLATKPDQLSNQTIRNWETDINVLRKQYGVPDEVYKNYINNIERAHEVYKQEVDSARKLQAFNHILAAIGNVFIARFAAAAKGPGIQALDLSGEMQQASRNLDAALKTEDKKLGVAQQRSQDERTLLNILQENERWNDMQQRYREAKTDSERREIKEDAKQELTRLWNLGTTAMNQANRNQERADRLESAREIKEANERSRADEQARKRREAEAKALQTRSDRLVSDVDKILGDKKIKSDSERLAAINTAITKSALPIPAEARKALTTEVGLWESLTGPSKERIRKELEQTIANSIQPHIDRVRSGQLSVVRFKKDGQPAMELPYSEYQKMSDTEKQQILGDGWSIEYK